MARARKRLIDDFLLPALNSQKYGMRLFWLNKEKGIFRIYWSHKNAAKWTSEDTIVFQEWDKLKGHYKPESVNYFMQSKQRFRAALYKLNPYIKKLKCPEKFHRDYQLLLNGDKKPSEHGGKSKAKSPKKTNQKSIPTSVICKNTSYIAKPDLKDHRMISQTSDFRYNNLQYFTESILLWEEYDQKMDRQQEKRISVEIAEKSPIEVHETSVLRENSSTPRVPHVAAQTIPTFCAYKQYQTRHHIIQNVPEVFVSKMYIGPENIPQRQEDTQSSAFDDINSGILNLSMRSDSSSNAPSR